MTDIIERAKKALEQIKLTGNDPINSGDIIFQLLNKLEKANRNIRYLELVIEEEVSSDATKEEREELKQLSQEF